MARLGGTNGIPWERERVYVQVHCVVDALGNVLPKRIDWDGQRSFQVLSCRALMEWGRWEAGNVVRCWEVEVARGVWRPLWWERGRFFVRQKRS